MALFLCAGLLALTACKSEDSSASEDAGDPGMCPPPAIAALVGRDVAALDAIYFEGALRVIRPSEAVTMDYNAQRVNVLLDDQDVITEVKCY
ncbi:I78 family peptidase inhibitor [Thioclava pacifica]|uniref:I78 family peptidase inhibitor n=1 Tax=Thioclava pacifica TaxID=285109 RepID=UPI000B00C94F|nr:I78 family peptidase inhibitor [Thioclava pacifica]